MGKPTAGGQDIATRVVAGNFTATGTSAWINVDSDAAFNVAIYGTFVATVTLEKSYDGGTTAVAVSRDAIGTPSSWTSPMSVLVSEPEAGILYRFNCTWTSGTCSYRISQ